MNPDRSSMALVMLDLIASSTSDESLAESFGNHEAVAAAATYLAGFAVQALALQRGEPVPATIGFLRRALGEGNDGGEGLAGVREPRTPPPSPGGARTATTDK